MAPLVVLDPYLLLKLPAELFGHAQVQFAVSDHLLPEEFPARDHAQIVQAVTREKVGTLSVRAVDLGDLLSMRNVLAFHQITSIAAARSHKCLFASDCCVFRRMAGQILAPTRVLRGADVLQLVGLN